MPVVVVDTAPIPRFAWWQRPAAGSAARRAGQLGGQDHPCGVGLWSGGDAGADAGTADHGQPADSRYRMCMDPLHTSVLPMAEVLVEMVGCNKSSSDAEANQKGDDKRDEHNNLKFPCEHQISLDLPLHALG